MLLENKIEKTRKIPFERLFARLVLKRTGYSALGDYAEHYNALLNQKGVLTAGVWYLFQIAMALPQFITYKLYWSFVMFKNYVKVAFRNIVKHKIYSSINVLSLSVGLASFLLAYLYVQHEFSYDRYHENADKIYRVAKGPRAYARGPAPMAEVLLNKYPEIVNTVRMDNFPFKDVVVVSGGNKSFYESQFYLADNSIFDIFSFTIISGDAQTPLSSPKSVVLTESMAKKYFGTDEPLGKTINFDDQVDFVVTAVAKDVPVNSHFRFDFLGSFASLDAIYGANYGEHWGRSNYYTYILLENERSYNNLSKKIRTFFQEERGDDEDTLFLQPLTSIHLRSDIAGEFEENGDLGSILIFSGIAIAILLIACMNFMNLYTATTEIRTKEVGLRKVIGARRGQLITQFMGEAMILSFLALPTALLLLEMVLPWFSNLLGVKLAMNYFDNVFFLAAIMGTTFIVGLISGGYPALFISALRPIATLKGKFVSGKKGLTFRNMLVVVQFTTSVVFIVSSLVLNEQMSFIREKKLGYNKENIVNIPVFNSDLRKNYQIYRDEVLNSPNVLKVTGSSFTPSVDRWREGMWFQGRQDNDRHMFYRIAGDHNLIDFFEMEVKEGRSFDKNLPADLKNAYILNEAAAEYLNWKNPIGKKFGRQEAGEVVGVVRNFHFHSLHRKVRPMVLSIDPAATRYISVKIAPENIPGTIDFLRTTWEKINPGYPFDYYFYDEEFDKLYKSEEKTSALFSSFTFLAIFIASLGLFGLASFTIQRRTKEIGIRKVLGAKFSKISAALTGEFIKLIVISNVIAWPLAHFFTGKWLENFAFTADRSVDTYVTATLITVAAGLLTISFHLIKAMHVNPVQTLKVD